VGLRPVSGAESWQVPVGSLAGEMRAPLDFNVLVFGALSGMPDSGGPVAVGGDASLQGFSVNGTAQHETGLLVGGRLSAANGTIHGNVAVGVALPTLESVTINGTTQIGNPLPFSQIQDSLRSLAQELAARPATGTATFQYSQLTLTGSHGGLNVFSVGSDVLAESRSVTIQVPGGSSVLVNVSGGSVTFENAGITLQGVERSRLLWNFVDASYLGFRSLGFQGSALAPVAAANLYDGSFDGTLVAATLTGNMEFHHHPLSGWDTFGVSASHTHRVVLRPDARLHSGCRYELRFGHGPLTTSGSCLPASGGVHFYVAPEDVTRFDRETNRRRYRSHERAPVGFSARDGVNTLVSDALARYTEALNLRPGIDSLTPDAPPRPSPVDPAREVSFYQQRYRGIPVEGHGYLVTEEAGLFRSAVGYVLPGLALSGTPATAQEHAIDVAVSHVNPATRPWTGPNPTADPPTAELLFAMPSSGTEALPRLSWRVGFSGIMEARWADVDALTGTVIRVQPVAARAVPEVECAGFDPALAELSGHIESDVRVPFSGTVTELHADLLLGLWEQDAVSYQTFNNVAPFVHRTKYIATPDFPSQDVTEHVCSQPSHQVSDGVAAVHWAMQATERRLSEFTFAGAPWEGASGVSSEGSVLATLGHDPSDPTGRRVETMSWVTDPPSGTAFLQINTRANFAGIVSHEFAHLANHNARARVGLPLLVFERESGALAEAYGDIVSAITVQREAQESTLNPWCTPPIDGIGCERRLDVPTSTPEQHPDTYGGEHWTFHTDDVSCDQENDYCAIHSNSTVASHWFYVLAHGRDVNETNDLGCAASVEPLAPELEESLQRAGQVVFSTFSMLPANADFLTAREQTAQIAFGLYGAQAEHAVEQAWHAVGVGAGARPVTLSPTEAETGVNPWPVTLRWEVGDQEGPWVVRYAADPDFTSSTTIAIGEAVEEANGRFVSTTVDLSADTTYYWQGREGLSSAPTVGWDNCSTFTSHFTTGSKKVALTVPNKVERDGYYRTSSSGVVRWEQVAGAGAYEFRLSMSEDGCEASDWTDVSSGLPWLFREIYLGDTISFNGVLFRDPLKLWPDVVLDEDRTYHLYARAKRGGQRGSCSHFKVRKTKLLPFEGVSPVDPGNDEPPPALPFASGGPFVWTPSVGAISYELSIYRRPALDPTTNELVLREQIDADEIVLNEDGNVSYTLHDPTATMVEGDITWDVRAIHSSGEEIPALDVNFGALEREFFNAAEEITDGVTDKGTHAPSSASVTDVNLALPYHWEDVTTRTCFATPRNTIGMFYWFGVPGSDVNPDDFVQIALDPTSQDEYSLCTEELTLLDNEAEMLLAVVPYSWNLGAPWGFGPEHQFRFLRTECGSNGQACCEVPGHDYNPCGRGLVCDRNDTTHETGTCVPCGNRTEQCCDDDSPNPCVSSFRNPLNCVLDAGEATCQSCGKLNGDCCDEVGSNTDRLENWCEGTGVFCDSGTCRECGGRGDSCCPSAHCTSDDDVCDGGTCKPRHRPCGRPVRAGGGAEGGRFTIDLGASSGVFDFDFNTFMHPDDIHLWIGDELLATTGCYGTAEIVPENHPDPFICTTNANASWCCDKNGDCVATLKYSSSSQLTVEVNANCSGLTPDTEWEFTANCPK
jgi:choice-of-anchor A domain-containing protein